MSMIRHPMYSNLRSFMRSPFDGWEDAFENSMMPAEGTILTKGRWVEDKYKVVYVRDESGEIVEWKYVKIKETDNEQQEGVSDGVSKG